MKFTGNCGLNNTKKQGGKRLPAHIYFMQTPDYQNIKGDPKGIALPSYGLIV
jgi:hypothetical protein